MLVPIYRIRTLEKNYPNPAEISQCSITVLTKTMLIITCRMFSRCHDSEDCNRTLCETFSCVRQLTSLIVLVLSRGHCDCYTHSVYILILISSEPLILIHRTHFKNHCCRMKHSIGNRKWSKRTSSLEIYEVHSISFQTFFVQAFIIAVNSRYFSMLLLYSL